MLYYQNINLLVSMIIAMIIVIPIYYAISTLRTSSYGARKSWKKVSGKSALTREEFINRVQKLCMHRKYILLEISPAHAFIKESMSFSTGGVLYYIELNAAEPGTVTVWARGSIYKNRINPNCLTGMMNMFYTK